MTGKAKPANSDAGALDWLTEYAARITEREGAGGYSSSDGACLRAVVLKWTAERDATRGLRGFAIDLSNQQCREDAEGSSPDFPCNQTGACITDWCDPCRARALLAKGTR